MQETIERLREVSLSVPVPVELPDDDDLVVIEEEILLPMPRDLKTFLKEVSDVVYGSIEPVTASDPYLHTHLPEVTATAWSEGVERHLIVICADSGTYYCMTPEGEVVHWVDGELTEGSWQDIWQWAREVWLES
ncbi:SMI1/KNR4 family protein [Corallincola holothuriorum]|uniref:SMI1/KNR4 family protein n=1 Tax=Corallincola holothuriorum TaxID=2282215 RepID=A0A368NSU6_9GAMM|nr:SMI1/KNR4 family protein [Corallincola holothuriorum]RCU52895.1 SMI1/KNR4 family protein [Corallincola holothuriorum]